MSGTFGEPGYTFGYTGGTFGSLPIPATQTPSRGSSGYILLAELFFEGGYYVQRIAGGNVHDGHAGG